jgi:hypothetical protein
MPSSISIQIRKCRSNCGTAKPITGALSSPLPMRSARIGQCGRQRLPSFLPASTAAVVLLGDIRDIFDVRGVDRLPSKRIVDHLNAADNGLWSEWRGIHGNQQPHNLSQGELARLLEPFQIRPQTIRFLCDDSEKATAKGYRREQFEGAWRSYCTGDATRSQSGNIRHLRSV